MNASASISVQSPSLPTLDQLIRRASEVTPLSFIAQRVIELLEHEEDSYDELTRVISRDQGLATRILRQANSPFYGLAREVTSISWAIVLLGAKTVKTIVVTAAFRNLYKKCGLGDKMLWEHAVACAIGSKMLSLHFEPRLAELAFLGGLLHDLGKTIMNSNTPDAYTHIIGECYANGVSFRDAEQDLYGYTHAEVGAGVMLQWQMPRELAQLVRYHHLDQDHALNDCAETGISKTLFCVVLANALCKQIPVGYKIAAAELDSAGVFASQKLCVNQDDLGQWQKRIESVFRSEEMHFG